MLRHARLITLIASEIPELFLMTEKAQKNYLLENEARLLEILAKNPEWFDAMPYRAQKAYIDSLKSEKSKRRYQLKRAGGRKLKEEREHELKQKELKEKRKKKKLTEKKDLGHEEKEIKEEEEEFKKLLKEHNDKKDKKKKVKPEDKVEEENKKLKKYIEMDDEKPKPKNQKYIEDYTKKFLTKDDEEDEPENENEKSKFGNDNEKISEELQKVKDVIDGKQTLKQVRDQLKKTEQEEKEKEEKRYEYNPELAKDELEKVLAPKDKEKELVELQAKALVKSLNDYGIDAEIDAKDAIYGPQVVRFKIKTKTPVVKIKKYEEDLSASLQLDYPLKVSTILGKGEGAGTVIDVPRVREKDKNGRDIPRSIPLEIGIKNLPEVAKDETKLFVPIGVSPTGEMLNYDLIDAPHMLIGGMTKSGKTVFLQTMLLSLMARKTPDDLELSIIDPKGLDFGVFNGSPFIKDGKVITDPKAAIEKIQYIRDVELPKRKAMLDKGGGTTNNIDVYNKKFPDNKMKPMVVVIDEYTNLGNALADLPTEEKGRKTPKDRFNKMLETLVQEARAAGIHIVLATQKPTTENVPSNIKDNTGAAAAFSVKTHNNSQAIIDESGAEDLLGTGDMLFKDNNKGTVVRAQSYYVPQDEIKKLMAKQIEENKSAWDKWQEKHPEEFKRLEDTLNEVDSPDAMSKIAESVGENVDPDELEGSINYLKSKQGEEGDNDSSNEDYSGYSVGVGSLFKVLLYGLVAAGLGLAFAPTLIHLVATDLPGLVQSILLTLYGHKANQGGIFEASVRVAAVPNKNKMNEMSEEKKKEMLQLILKGFFNYLREKNKSKK